MKRLSTILLAALLLLGMSACGAGAEEASSETRPEDTPEVAVVQESEETASLPSAETGWETAYLAFLEDNYDIFAALWPEGLSGVGFIDLDLDGTPELLVFDLGASATLGVQIFDLVDGQVYCVSSVTESAAGAFGGEHFSKISVCASYFEAFRLVEQAGERNFWVRSTNGTLESTWDELIRFDCVDGVLVPVSVCGQYMESDIETGDIVAEEYTVAGAVSDAAGYEEAAEAFEQGIDTGYEAVGMFLWDNMKRYDTTYDGFLAMAADAATAYVPATAS